MRGEAVELDAAFELVGELAHLLHRQGHHEIGTMLDLATDLRELEQRRQACAPGLFGPTSDVVDYVLAQMAELSALMAASGRDDLAALFSTPANLLDASKDVAQALAA